MKVKVKKDEVKLTLSREEAQRLTGLLDLPVWVNQPRALEDWLAHSHQLLIDELGYADHEDIGFRRS